MDNGCKPTDPDEATTASAEPTSRSPVQAWLALVNHLTAQEHAGCDVKRTLQAAAQVLGALDKLILPTLPPHAPATDFEISVTLPESPRQAADNCLLYSHLIASCALVAAFFPDDLDTSTFVRLHDDQLNAGLPVLAERDFLRSELSVTARRFIDNRPGEDLRAVAAGLGLVFASALRHATAAGTSLLLRDTARHARPSDIRFRAGQCSAVSAEEAIFAAARGASKFMDQFGGFNAIREQPLAKDVYESWRFLVCHRFWEHLPAATTDDRLRLLDQLAPVTRLPTDATRLDDSTPPGPRRSLPLTFENGAFRYKGGPRQKLTGKPLQVLKRLAAAPNHTLSIRELGKIVWGYGDIDGDHDDTIRSAVSAARRALRGTMRDAGEIGPDDVFDPIPCVDKRPNLAWKLELPDR
jgi:hypothetical protein